MKHVDTKKLKPVKKSGVDLDQQAGAEEAKRMYELLENMGQGVIVWGADRRCEFISKRVYDMIDVSEDDLHVGVDRNEFIQRAVREREYTAADAKKISDSMESLEPFKFIRTSKGRHRLLTAGRPQPDGRLFVTFTDVTEQKRTEAALAAAKAQSEAAEHRLKEELEKANQEKKLMEKKQAELERLSLIAAHAKDLVLISDATNRIEWANEAYLRHNGLDLEMDLMGKSARDVLVGSETDPATLAEIDEAVRARKALTVGIYCYRRTGEAYWMEQEITPVFNAAGEHTNFIMVGRDVTERLIAAQSAQEAQEFEESKRDESRLLAEFNEWLQSSDCLEELFTVVSSFLEKLLPGSAGSVYVYADTRDLLESVCSWSKDATLSHFEPPDCWALRRGRAYFYGRNTMDFYCTHVKREWEGQQTPEQYFCLPIIAHGDTVGLLHISFEESSQVEGQDRQKLANFCAEQISLAIANVSLREQLREQSTRDPLTGLYNRRYFLDYAKRELHRCASAKKCAGLIALDIDHFKKFNDTHGHDAGDEVLKMLSEVLQTLFREGDVPCRMGGEEFIVMLPGADIDKTAERAEKLRSEIEAQDLRYGGETLKVTASIGISVYQKHGKSLEALMREADEALYAAKDGGRNIVKIADLS